MMRYQGATRITEMYAEQDRLTNISLTQRMLVCFLGLALMSSRLYAFHVFDVVVYPDPSPPMIEVITQYPDPG